MSASKPTEIRAILVRQEEAQDPPVRVFGLEPIERLRRTAKRLGATRCDVLDAGEYPPLDPGDARYLVLRAELFYDERLLVGLVENPNVVLADPLPGHQAAEALAAHVDGANLPVAVAALRGLEYQDVGAEPSADPSASPALHFAKALEVAPAFNPKLRKFLPPFVFRAEPENVHKIENAIFKASYKGVTDLVTKWG